MHNLPIHYKQSKNDRVEIGTSFGPAVAFHEHNTILRSAQAQLSRSYLPPFDGIQIPIQNLDYPIYV